VFFEIRSFRFTRAHIGLAMKLPTKPCGTVRYVRGFDLQRAVVQVNQPRSGHLAVVKTFTQDTESFFGKGVGRALCEWEFG